MNSWFEMVFLVVVLIVIEPKEILLRSLHRNLLQLFSSQTPWALENLESKCQSKLWLTKLLQDRLSPSKKNYFYLRQ